MNLLDHVAEGVEWTLAGILMLLVVASILVRVLRSTKPDASFEELTLRVRTWWILASVFAIALIVGRTVSLVVFAFVSFLALKEYFTAIPTRRADRRVLFWAYLSIPVQYYWVADTWYGLFIIFIPVYVALLVQIRMILIGDTDGFLESVGKIQWGLMVTVFGLSHAAYLLVLEDPAGAVIGPGLVLYLVLLTQLNDVAQFLWGKSIGGPKVVPKVSPGKTWSGFLCGVGTTMLLGTLLAPVLTPGDFTVWWYGLAGGALIGVGGFFGDLTISCMKRDLGIKDSGSMLPGHGGILDRVDSLTYTAPLFFHYAYWLYL